jgi:bifunctional ADP-heptose synthase (sugar kinase/adenylyltransferase)
VGASTNRKSQIKYDGWREELYMGVHDEMRVVVVTGGFDPLHSGHIAYFKAAK